MGISSINFLKFKSNSIPLPEALKALPGALCRTTSVYWPLLGARQYNWCFLILVSLHVPNDTLDRQNMPRFYGGGS